MSIGWQSFIWKGGGPDKKPELLLLLCIADHARVGGSAYPGVARLAKMTRDTPRNVLRLLSRLVAHGWVSINTSCGKKTKYQLAVHKIANLGLAAGGDLSKEEKEIFDWLRSQPVTFRDETSDIPGSQPVTFRDETSDIPGSQYRGTVIQPSVEPTEQKEPVVELPSSVSRVLIQNSGTDARIDEWQPPPWIDREAWNGFLEMRAEKRKPMTNRARDLIVQKLARFEAQGISSTECLNNSVMNSWQSVFAPRDEGKGANYGRSSKRENIANSSRKAAQLLEGERLDSVKNRDGRVDEVRLASRPRIESVPGQTLAPDAGFDWGRSI